MDFWVELCYFDFVIWDYCLNIFWGVDEVNKFGDGGLVG